MIARTGVWRWLIKLGQKVKMNIGKKADRQYALKRNFVEFGSYLHEMRTKANLTQRQVSIALGYSSAQFISNFERGITLPPLCKIKILMRLYRMPKRQVVQMIIEAKTKVIDDSL